MPLQRPMTSAQAALSASDHHDGDSNKAPATELPPTSPDSVAVALDTPPSMMTLNSPATKVPDQTGTKATLVAPRLHRQAFLFVTFIYCLGLMLPARTQAGFTQETGPPSVRSSLTVPSAQERGPPLAAWTWPARLPQQHREAARQQWLPQRREVEKDGSSATLCSVDAELSVLPSAACLAVEPLDRHTMLLDRLDTSFGMGFY